MHEAWLRSRHLGEFHEDASEFSNRRLKEWVAVHCMVRGLSAAFQNPLRPIKPVASACNGRRIRFLENTFRLRTSSGWPRV
jgi:hypothetical protein